MSRIHVSLSNHDSRLPSPFVHDAKTGLEVCDAEYHLYGNDHTCLTVTAKIKVGGGGPYSGGWTREIRIPLSSMNYWYTERA